MTLMEEFVGISFKSVEQKELHTSKTNKENYKFIKPDF